MQVNDGWPQHANHLRGDHLGLTTETVSRVLIPLRTDGLIALPAPSDMRLIDRDPLTELAEGG